MTVTYTKTALRQIDAILIYLEARHPTASRNVGNRLREMIELIALHPGLGRATDRPRQRRIVVTPYPYAVLYRVDGPNVTIQRVRHTSRRPPAE